MRRRFQRSGWSFDADAGFAGERANGGVAGIARTEGGEAKLRAIAWVEKNGDLSAAKFQDFLLRHDGTGLPFRPARALNTDERQSLGTARGRTFNGDFTLEVRGEGLGGLINAF